MITSHSRSTQVKYARWLWIGLVCTVGLLLAVAAVDAMSATGPAVPIAQSSTTSAETNATGDATFPFAHSLLVAHLIGEVRQSGVYSYVGYLSGEFPISVGGQPFTLKTRNMYYTSSIAKATQYVYEFMQAQGLSVAYHEWYDAGEDLSGRNVIGVLTGTVRPAEIVLISAHLDNMPEKSVAPGADDNASGSVAVMVAAAGMAGHQFQRTVRFVFFTGEEQGLLGSDAYAKATKARGDNIVAVYNMDMIGWDANQDGVMALETRYKSSPGYSSDLAIAGIFTQVVKTYGLTGLRPFVDACNDQWVDSASFWKVGYPSVTAIEEWDEGNPYYHTANDTLATLNLSFFTSIVKASVGTVAHLAIPVDSSFATRKIYLPLVMKWFNN
jgi:Zn-dependent M28 family amino/carboxypeptidase